MEGGGRYYDQHHRPQQLQGDWTCSDMRTRRHSELTLRRGGDRSASEGAGAAARDTMEPTHTPREGCPARRAALLPGASGDAQKTRESTESSQSARNGMWLLVLFFFPLFFSFYFFYIVFFNIYIFFFAKIPKAGQTHRKQATGTATKHCSAVRILQLTTVGEFSVTSLSLL